jgi:hypothetical protein
MPPRHDADSGIVALGLDPKLTCRHETVGRATTAAGLALSFSRCNHNSASNKGEQ